MRSAAMPASRAARSRAASSSIVSATTSSYTARPYMSADRPRLCMMTTAARVRATTPASAGS